MHPIVIIGSGMAGYAAAREFRKLNTEQELIMICADDAANYAKPTLSNAFTGKTGKQSTALTAQIAAEPENTELYAERGKLHYRLNEWGAALNDFNRVLQLDDSHAEARQYAQMVQEILEFRYKDIYNP